MIIEKKHFEYLVNQHGRVSDARHDFDAWKKAYEASICSIWDSIVPYLPRSARNTLDIGSGLGGIDILLHRLYGPETCVCLLDGDETPPEVEWSFKPHNSMSVAFDFLYKNGVSNTNAITPGNLGKWAGPKFDLVVSFAAWCFHIHPGDYLDDLKTVIHDKTVIILEVRRTKADWLRALLEAFGEPKVIDKAEKYVRVAFNA
jgi:hypothetical protein